MTAAEHEKQLALILQSLLAVHHPDVYQNRKPKR